MTDIFTYKGVDYDVSIPSKDTRHGGPFDRGSADSYYQRGVRPHYYVGGTGMSDRVEQEDMTREEISAYMAGFEYNESVTMAYKEW